MCLAVPGQILEISGLRAMVDFRGVKRHADVSLVDSPALGDYVLVHAGFAIQKLDPDDAIERLSLFDQISAIMAGDGVEAGGEGPQV